MSIWIEIFKVDKEKKGVKETIIFSLNEEYEPLKDAFKILLKALVGQVREGIV